MSWLSDLANKAENFLNTLDNSAAEVFRSTNQQEFLEEHISDNVDNNRTYPIETSFRYHTLTDSNQPNELLINSRHDMPVTVIPLETSASTRFYQSLSESNNQRTLIDNISSELSSSSSVQSKISRNKDLKSSAKSNSLIQQSTDLDLFDFLNTKSVNSDQITNPLERDVVRRDSLLSTSDKIEEDQSSGYETSLSTKHSGTPIKTSKGEESFTVTAVHKPEVLSEDSCKQSKNTHSSIISDLQLENKLLRSEVSSLSQEVSGLLRRNHKASEEIKQLTGQADRLNNQLKDSDQRVRELQIKIKESELSKTSSTNNVELLEAKLRQTETELSTVQNDLKYVQSQLEKNKLTINTLEASLYESRQQSLIADKRIELTQNDNIRLTRELTQYKEKANHILAMKERVISSLRGQDVNLDQLQTTVVNSEDNPENELIISIRAECDLLREEATRWHLEVEHREMAMQELELQMQAEKDSLRRNIELCEQQAEREKQLREEADTELAHTRQSIRELEETFSRQKADLHNKLMSTESELARLRQIASNESVRNTPPSRIDPENIITLESRIRQLTDNLLSKQDALDSVLAQNHALKIRLDRVLSDNESLISALPNNTDTQLILGYGRSYQSSVGVYGCTKLNLHDTPIPKRLRPLAYRIDHFGIKIVNIFRRFPVIRLATIIYLIILHLSIIIKFFIPMDNMNKKTVTIDGSGSSSSSKLAIENPPIEGNQLPLVLDKP
ncbi:unnamed protein product [Schistosoma rodhaini]|uniref:Putative golgin-84 n=1 Tax=Schistosoma mansoni TaxID=6183 RepID=G4V875_SCHMA|nr:putative golgin-84 [Schistosoma mansoni]CAH8429695.1 unnamed protein product [Schistosoma rodhaini]|eukprot:XP_018648962.1 putative golgin-84 [Schistosoma mansoni]